MAPPAISEERFWEIIEEARKGSSRSADPKALSRVLSRLSDREVSAFGYMFYEKLCALNFQKLWAAGDIIVGGMSGDQFHYFRSWIIGKGRTLFDVAIRDPDQIGPWIDGSTINDRDVDNELLEYVAVEIMQKRGAEDPRELSDCHPDAMPRGRRFTEKTVRKVCPKLAALFK
ncbi:MAG TPA: DUF4240 domain-containing protein [Candidatus Angelobacter sp.]|nr:DUF4240 domain-containing protein [Candidatus Angelobacter sp.]